MANEENLIPLDQRTKNEQREIQSKGGRASGRSRRRKRTMRQAAAVLLGAGLDGCDQKFVEKITPRLLALGIDVEDATYQDVFLAGILLKAIKGDVRAAEFMRDTAGENPVFELKKQELKLRKAELKFRQEQAALTTAQEDSGNVPAINIICDIPREQVVPIDPAADQRVLEALKLDREENDE